MLLLLSSFSKRVGKHTISNLIVLLHQPRQSDQLPVESVSVRPATPVVAVVSVPTAIRELLDLLEPPPLVPDSDDDDSNDEAQPRASINSTTDDDKKKRDPRSQFYVRSPPARQNVAASRSTPAKLQVPRPTFQSRSPAQSQQPTAAITHVSRVTPLIFTAATSDDIVLYLDTDAFWATTMLYHPILHSSQHVKSSKWDKKTEPKRVFYSIWTSPDCTHFCFSSNSARIRS